MTNALSRLRQAFDTWSFRYNCYEAVHPWTPHCSDSALDLGLTVFGEAFKLYTPLYLVSQLSRRKFDYDSFKATWQSVLRSTSFISANAFFAILFFCSSQYLTGKFHYYAAAYLPAFLASSMAVLIEKPSRRSSLAFYVSNVASEALFRIHVARGNIKPLKHGQVYLFMVSIATIMYLARRHGRFDDDPLSSAIKFIVGPEEAWAPRAQLVSPQKEQQPVPTLELLNWWPKKHELCPHAENSCSFYVAKAAGRAFLYGWAAALAMRLASRVPVIIKNPRLAFELASDVGLLRLGVFLAAFSGLYKGFNCSQRHWLATSGPQERFVAASLAGLAMFVYPSPTVALYVLWKCLEALFNEAVAVGLVRHREAAIVLLYGLSTSQLFYSAMLNPKHMKRSYMSFLDRISRHRLHMVNRSVLDVFGTEASAGYEEFFPDLHPKYMSRPFLASIWIWMIEQKFQAKRLDEGIA